MIENAWFITGIHELPGTLTDTIPQTLDDGFLSPLVHCICPLKKLVFLLDNSIRNVFKS